MEKRIEPISYEVNGWKYDEEDGYVKPVWFTGTQCSPLPYLRDRSEKGWLKRKMVTKQIVMKSDEIRKRKRKKGRQGQKSKGNAIKEKAAEDGSL